MQRKEALSRSLIKAEIYCKLKNLPNHEITDEMAVLPLPAGVAIDGMRFKVGYNKQRPSRCNEYRMENLLYI